MTTRRDVLTAIAGLGVAGFGALPSFALRAQDVAKADTPLKLLVLGGTGFLGPHFVAAARGRGHALSLFNRGKTNPERFSGDAFADIEQLHGDRKANMAALAGERRWDAVLDTSAYVPADVDRAAQLLGPRIDRYLLVSTVSVYARNDIIDQDESGTLITLPDLSVTEVSGETYGGLKALCERSVQAALPGRAVVVRPGLIAGPGDATDRFTYWPVRADRGGEILCPGSAGDPTQFIDVRDLAAFLLRLIETRSTGIFNANAPAGSLHMGEVLAACQQAAGTRSTLTWVPAGFLGSHKVAPWSDMPAWIPASGEYAGFGRTSTVRAQRAGLTCRPVLDTATDTLAWWRTQPEGRHADLKAGLDARREADILRAWHAHAVAVEARSA